VSRVSLGMHTSRRSVSLFVRASGIRSWRYINVRRLFLMVEESIDEGTLWVVFGPNDEPYGRA
jgi:phage tail sheath protein FI